MFDTRYVGLSGPWLARGAALTEASAILTVAGGKFFADGGVRGVRFGLTVTGIVLVFLKPILSAR